MLGDTHGHDSWKRVVEIEKDADKFVFLGDYFDSFSINTDTQVENFKDILAFADNGKTVILLGNHDYHYLCDLRHGYSGFNGVRKLVVQPLLKRAIEEGKIELLHIEGDIIMSHAGVTDYWLNNVCDVHDLAEISLETINLSTLDFNILKGYSAYGNTISNSPIWVRPYSLSEDHVKGYRQIVGHTCMRNAVNDGDFWFCDTMHMGDYICIDNGIITIKNYK